MFDPIVRFFLTTQARGQEVAGKMRDQEGASAVEYGLLVSLIAAAIVLAITGLGGALRDLFNQVAGDI